jgi:DHA1 family bicyclomycin/chloramphenicol resistance-like MFS transporter
VLKRDQPAMTVLLGALIAIAPLAMDIYLASMPSMTRSLAATPEQVQLTLSLYMYGWGLSQILVGPLTDRFGRRPALIAGLVVFVAASLACAASRDIHTLIASRVAQAIGMATVAVVPRAVVRDLYTGEHAARILSLMGIVLGIAPIVAPIIGSHLHVWFGWQANFIFVAAYGTVALACVVGAFPETIRERNASATAPRVVLASYARLLRSRRYVGYLLVAAFASSGLFAFLAGSAFVFVSVIGTGEQGFGFLFGAVMLGNITGATIGSRLVTRLGIDRMLGYATWLMLFAGALLAALAWARVSHPLAVVAPMFLFMIALMTTMPQATAGGLSAFPEVAGSAASLLLFCQFVLASTAALVVGVTFDGTQRPMATTIFAAALLSFAAFRVLARRRAAGV